MTINTNYICQSFYALTILLTLLTVLLLFVLFTRVGTQQSGSERKRRALTLVKYRAYTIWNIVSCGKELVTRTGFEPMLTA